MTCDAFRSKRKNFYWIRYRRYRVGNISKHSHFFNMTKPLLFSLVFNNWFNITPSLTFNFNLYFSSIWIKTKYTMYLQGYHNSSNMMDTRYIQLCASMICIVLLTSLQLYVKEQTRMSQTKLLPYVPNPIPTPVKEPNTTLCPQGRPKPTIDDILCMVSISLFLLHSNKRNSIKSWRTNCYFNASVFNKQK